MDLTRGQRFLVLAGLAAVLVGVVILTFSRFDHSPTSVVYPAAPTVPAPQPRVVVHVVGAVARPGVYELASGARVSDVVARAGGLLPQADQSSVNMAALAVDGQQIVVRSAAAATAPLPPPPAPSAPPASPALTPAPAPAVPIARPNLPQTAPAVVSLNQASKPQLEALPGIGPELAQRILYYRYENGGFRSVDDLLRVEGIGPEKLEAVRPYLRP